MNHGFMVPRLVGSIAFRLVARKNTMVGGIAEETYTHDGSHQGKRGRGAGEEEGGEGAMGSCMARPYDSHPPTICTSCCLQCGSIDKAGFSRSNHFLKVHL